MKLLAGIVRLAEGLDRSHSQTISSLHLREKKDGLVIRLRAGGDAELELWAAERHTQPLADALGKPIKFDVTSQKGKERVRHAKHSRSHHTRIPESCSSSRASTGREKQRSSACSRSG